MYTYTKEQKKYIREKELALYEKARQDIRELNRYMDKAMQDYENNTGVFAPENL